MLEKWNAPGAAGDSARGREGLAGKADTSEIPETNTSRQSFRWTVAPDGGVPFTIEAPGRMSWALSVLKLAGPVGVTTAELPPGLRWSAYVHKLRRLGVRIVTDREPNKGPLGGHHARYRLGCNVQREGEV